MNRRVLERVIGVWRELIVVRLSLAVVAEAQATRPRGLAVTGDMSHDLSHIPEPDVAFLSFYFILIYQFFLLRGKGAASRRWWWTRYQIVPLRGCGRAGGMF